MKWTESTAVKLVITQIKNVDPVTVFLENYGGGRGKLTIETFGEAWSSYWGAMGDGRTLEQFILKCDNHYLSKNLATLAALSESDYDGFLLNAKRHVIWERQTGAIDKASARDKWNLIGDVVPEKDYFHQDSNWGTLATIAGDDWWDEIPKKDSAVYEQLCIILDAIKACLTERGINLEAA